MERSPSLPPMTTKELIDQLSKVEPDTEIISGTWNGRVDTYTVLESGGTISDKNDGTYTTGPEYWAGWVLAYYQWLSRRSFAYMQRKGLGADTVVSMYHPLHEADLSKFADVADGILSEGDEQ